MKFTIGSNEDKLLTTTIAHEYMKCKDYFELFVENETRLTHLDTKRLRIRSFNLYTAFLTHLYEFYHGCFKRDQKSFAKIPHDKLDKLINFEAQKILNIIIDRLESGRGEGWENDINIYKIPLPEKFGEHFRWIRNRYSHVDPKRTSGADITLSDFFTQYHMYIYLLYSFPAWIWNVKNLDTFDFQDIERFRVSVKGSKK